MQFVTVKRDFLVGLGRADHQQKTEQYGKAVSNVHGITV
jgi:hypothetical protein